jgi:hypothetical protein
MKEHKEYDVRGRARVLSRLLSFILLLLLLLSPARTGDTVSCLCVMGC